MATATLVLHVASIVCLLFEAVGVNAPRVKLGWLGLFLWFLPLVVSL